MKQSELKYWAGVVVCAVLGLICFWLFVYLLFSF